MANQFTHRQDSIFAQTSICLKCLRVVATRERESELRADEAIHSCKISLPGTKSDPAYWGVLCRTCAELVAFGTIPAQNSGPGADGSNPGTIRCNQGHTHIYFPRDFRLYPSAVTIADVTMQESVRVYRAVNPSWRSTSHALHGEPDTPAKEEEFSIDGEVLDRTGIHDARPLPDSPRELAKKVAKERWVAWALKKTIGLQ